MARKGLSASPVKIKVIGLGGGGSNAISRMVREGIRGVELIAANTDGQALSICEAPTRLQLGGMLTRGLGAGADQVIGQKAAEESREDLKATLSGADMIFITAGMGGGTGTGAAPIVADIAKQSGALTIAIVTRPFSFEGVRRSRVAIEGITRLLDKVDTLIIIPNDRLLSLCDSKTTIDSAFKLADDVLKNGVQAIAEVITAPGMINVDFADVKAVMKDAGPAWMSIGRGVGQNRAVDAARDALASPILDVAIEGAKAVLYNVVGNDNLSLYEVNQAAEVIRQAMDPEANIMFGVVQNPHMENEVRITLIATGFTTKFGSSIDDRREEMVKLLQTLKSEDELDIPTFLRRPSFRQRRRGIAPSDKPSEVPPRDAVSQN